MIMTVLKWFCFALVCLDVVCYIIDKGKQENIGVAKFVGFMTGIAARCFVLYGTLTSWIL